MRHTPGSSPLIALSACALTWDRPHIIVSSCQILKNPPYSHLKSDDFFIIFSRYSSPIFLLDFQISCVLVTSSFCYPLLNECSEMQSSFRLLEFNPDQSPLLYAHVHWHLGAHMLAEAEAGAGSGRVRPVWSQVGEEGHHHWCQQCQWCLGKPGCLPISGPIFSRLALADVRGSIN